MTALSTGCTQPTSVVDKSRVHLRLLGISGIRVRLKVAMGHKCLGASACRDIASLGGPNEFK